MRSSYIQGYLELPAKNCTLDVSNKKIPRVIILINRTIISYSYEKNNAKMNDFSGGCKNLVYVCTLVYLVVKGRNIWLFGKVGHASSNENESKSDTPCWAWILLLIQSIVQETPLGIIQDIPIGRITTADATWAMWSETRKITQHNNMSPQHSYLRNTSYTQVQSIIQSPLDNYLIFF